MATLREFPQLSYVATVLGDDWGYTQRSPDQQIIPAHLLDRVREAEADLARHPDSALETLGKPPAEEGAWEKIEEMFRPDTIEIVNHIYQDELYDVVFLTADEQWPEDAAQAEAALV